MVSPKERIVWIFVILIAVVSTFLITSKSIVAPQSKNSNIASATPSTDVEKEADQWFTSLSPSPVSKAPPIPSREKYTQRTNIDAPLQIYQEEIKRNSPWINYPEQIVLRVFYPPPEVEGFVPGKVSIYYYNTNIVTVTVAVSGPYGASEERFDFVKVDNIWKIVWVGERSIDIGP